MDVKKMIIHNLDTLKHNETVQYKKKLYTQAISNIQKMSMIELSDRIDFTDIKGIGKKISDKILHVRDNKKNLDEVESLMSNISMQQDNSAFDLRSVFGIGPIAQKRIVEKYGKIDSAEELLRLDAEHNFLTKAQKCGVKYHQDIQQSIPRSEMIEHDAFLSQFIMKHMPEVIHHISGSFRRGAMKSGDVDVLIYAKDVSDAKGLEKTFKSFVLGLKQCGYILEDLAFGDSKFMGLCKLPGEKFESFRRIDIIITTAEEYYFSLFYFTGNDDFNKEFRAHALQKGFSLNQKGITDVKTKEHVSGCFDSEQSIFDFFEVQYREPQNRTSGSIETISSS